MLVVINSDSLPPSLPLPPPSHFQTFNYNASYPSHTLDNIYYYYYYDKELIQVCMQL